MKALVTGGAGFIGQRLVRRLDWAGWDVVVIDDFSTHEGPSFKWPTTRGRVLPGKVQDVTLGSFFPDVIFHLAGKVGPLGVMKFKGSIAEDTITAASKVAYWAENSNSLVIDISTSEVYGDATKDNSESDLPVIQPASPRSEYAVSKLAAEHMLLNRDIRVRIVRPFNVAGYGQRTEGGFVIPRFIRQALDKEPITVYAPGSQVRSFTHIDDFVDGLALVYRDGEDGEIYNLGNPNNKTTILSAAQRVADYLHVEGFEGNIQIVDPYELHGTDFWEAPDKTPNSTKAISGLGWAPWRGLNMIILDSILYAKGY